MRRMRSTKILATLGPASSTNAQIEALFLAGADVFRLNFSHGSHDEHKARFAKIRALEKATGRPIGILADLQGPKLRVGEIGGGETLLIPGTRYRFDLDKAPGDERRAPLPHPELIEALEKGTPLLLDDGRLRLRVEKSGKGYVETEVIVGGVLKSRKGINVPEVLLPVTALTRKDESDLQFALDLGVDWVALSFVQQPEDVAEAKKLIAGRAALMAKIEKPLALRRLDEIIDLSEGIMVARGDLGVELPVEEVPGQQKRIIQMARDAGKPVVVATQMLESMVSAPIPTRAEVTDVASAIFDGADAVMLSAESAAGTYPVEAVAMMNRIAQQVEREPQYRALMDAKHAAPEATTADAISAAARQVANTIGAAAIVTYTTSGSTAIRASRERSEAPIMVLTPRLATARRLAIVWSLHCVHSDDAKNFGDMVQRASRTAIKEGFAKAGDRIVIMAGVPFGTPGATNILRIAQVTG
ncbi:pyruvate kinase [Oceanibacterium hippocampi]|uniref:Pyruvate kinase n=1 Tax=Oceanibacterium hippocampi TaxID=745714 RepID=A0A1Y5SAP7_9PROT|nr:pyruvate kinase [Oceanibacterium hippocampi]SLN35231.1 Pyruvate kinase [Oceanibacterium hippocampi]